MKEPNVSYLLPYPNHKIKAHRFGINKLLLHSPLVADVDSNENYMFSAGRDGTIKCWLLNGNKQDNIQSPTGSDHHSSVHKHVFSLEEHVDWVSDMIILSDKQHLISSSHDNTIMLWDIGIDNPKHCLTYRYGIMRI